MKLTVGTFIKTFFDFQNPQPLKTQFTEEQLRNNDMKISLQIATNSYLRMQSDPKTNLVSFSCKNYGKNCFQIFATKNNKNYLIETDYKTLRHHKQCELLGVSFEYLKIYNLMKLKKHLIEKFMIQHDLMNSSPSEILSAVSEEQQYFFEKKINYNCEMRRKLRKRFDNIVNIDIKKITKGGRQLNQINQNSFIQEVRNPKSQKVKKSGQGKKYTQFNQQNDLFSTYNSKHSKNKSIKKVQKIQKQKNKYRKLDQKRQKIEQKNKQNINIIDVHNMEEEIFINSDSQSQLKEIKQLNEEFNGFDDIFSWSSDEKYQPVYAQTINDKVRENVFLSLRNSLLKKSLETQSLSNFNETIPQLNEFGEEEQII